MSKKKEVMFDSCPIAVETLLEEYRKDKHVYRAEKVNFSGVDGLDVYNISRPFTLNGKTYIAGRVEPRNSEISEVRFFEKYTANSYKVVDAVSLPNLQDPCVIEYGNGIILGGTKIVTDGEKIVSWYTAFYCGKELDNLRECATAPQGMKDVRLLILKNKICVFTRPQGDEAGLGKIGFITVKNLNEIRPEKLGQAQLLDCFIKSEWGGANELFLLNNGLIGVLGHISCRTIENGEQRLHYYPMTFAFDSKMRRRSAIKIIAERCDFCAGPAKRPDLIDVLFTGGLVRRADGKAELYTGTSDAEGQFVIIDDPFVEYEASGLGSENIAIFSMENEKGFSSDFCRTAVYWVLCRLR